MVAENKIFHDIINQGPGWSQEQSTEHDEVTCKMEEEKLSLEKTRKNILVSVHQIEIVEKNLKELDLQRKQIDSDTLLVDRNLRSLHEAVEAKELEKNEVENELENTHNQYQLKRQEVKDCSDEIEITKAESKLKLQRINEKQNYFSNLCGECDNLRSKIDKVSKELHSEKHLIVDEEKNNVNKLKEINEKEVEVRNSTHEITVIEKKKELISRKIMDEEKKRILNEGRCDELKVKVLKAENVDLKMKRKEVDALNRLFGRLQKELEVLNRRKDMSCKSSSIVKDLITTNLSTLKTLYAEYDGLLTATKQNHSQIKSLTICLNEERHKSESVSYKRKEMVCRLDEGDVKIDDLHKQLGDAEGRLKHQQTLCDSMKAECNTYSKKLAESSEELHYTKRELEVICSETEQLKKEIVSTESDLIVEHYNHHHANEEREKLKTDLDVLRDQISKTEQKIHDKNSELSRLHILIDDVDSDCEKLSHEYKTMVISRDSIGALLIQKSDDLDKLQEKIKSQSSMLHHSELNYKDIMASLSDTIAQIRNLHAEKLSCDDFTKKQDDMIRQVRSLESEIHREKIKSSALREEIRRPMNVHRWRSLEHHDPPKYEMIQAVQQLQKRIIDTADKIAEKDILIRENERIYMQIKRVLDSQPQLSEVLEEIETYQINLNKKQTQKKEIEIEIQRQKSKVSHLKEELISLRAQKKQIEDSWIQSRTK